MERKICVICWSGWRVGGRSRRFCFRAGDEIRGRRERGKDLQLAYSLPWLECTKVVKINK